MTQMQDRKVEGNVFNIQKYSVHDGPGIRTIVFFKGCPLRCRWCSNPESQVFTPELAFNSGRCLGFEQCQLCLKACERQAIEASGEKPVFKREICAACERPCVKACPSSGVIVYGQRKSVDEVLKVVEQDAIFYALSGGGLTLSGGEPLAQPQFCMALLREAKRRRLDTSMETSGFAPYDILHAAAENLDSLMFDVKSLNEEKHLEYTGVSLAPILRNLSDLRRDFPGLCLHVRTPVIPGFNDTAEDVKAIAEFVSGLGGATYELLPYHRLGTQKYAFLNRECLMGEASLADSTFNMLCTKIDGNGEIE